MDTGNSIRYGFNVANDGVSVAHKSERLNGTSITRTEYSDDW